MYSRLCILISILITAKANNKAKIGDDDHVGVRGCVSFKSVQAEIYECLGNMFVNEAADILPWRTSIVQPYGVNSTFLINANNSEKGLPQNHFKAVKVLFPMPNRMISAAGKATPPPPLVRRKRALVAMDHATRTDKHYVLWVSNLMDLWRVMCEFDRDDSIPEADRARFATCIREELRLPAYNNFNPNDKIDNSGIFSYPHGVCQHEDQITKATHIADEWSQLICPNLEGKIQIIEDSFESVGMWLTLLPNWTILNSHDPSVLSEFRENTCMDYSTWRSFRSLWMEECDAVYNTALGQVEDFEWDFYITRLQAATDMRAGCIRRLLSRETRCDDATIRNMLLTVIWVGSLPGINYFDTRLAEPGYRPSGTQHGLCPKRHTLAIWSLQFMWTLFGNSQFCRHYTSHGGTILSTDRMLITGELLGNDGLRSVRIVFYKEGSDRLVDAIYDTSINPVDNFVCRSDIPEECQAKRDKLREKFIDDTDIATSWLARRSTSLPTVFDNERKDIREGELYIKSKNPPGDAESVDIYDRIGQTVISVTMTDVRPRLHLVISVPDYVAKTSHGLLISGCPLVTRDDHVTFVEDLANQQFDDTTKIVQKCREKGCNTLLGRLFLHDSCMALCLLDKSYNTARDSMARWVIEGRLLRFQKLCVINEATTPLNGDSTRPGVTMWTFITLVMSTVCVQ